MIPVKLLRYDKELDGEAFWQVYQDPSNCEFFRRIPSNWTKRQIFDFEEHTQSQLYRIVYEDNTIGFMVIVSVCAFSLSCQTGMLLLEPYRDKIISGMKLAFWALFAMGRMLFETTTIRKFSLRFLKQRADLEKSFIKGGLRKEGEFKESCFCYGKFQDELEYAADKELYENCYKNITFGG